MTELKCTDEDVKRLKEELKLGYTTLTTTGEYSGMKALLARLEAAERTCHAAWQIEDCIQLPENLGDSATRTMLRAIADFRESYESWRKACGKAAGR